MDDLSSEDDNDDDYNGEDSDFDDCKKKSKTKSKLKQATKTPAASKVKTAPGKATKAAVPKPSGRILEWILQRLFLWYRCCFICPKDSTSFWTPMPDVMKKSFKSLSNM